MSHDPAMQLDADTGVLRYQICGLILVSNTPFPELTPAVEMPPETESEITVRLSPGGESPPLPLQWLRPASLEENPWLSCARTQQGYLLRFHELADFLVDAEGRHITAMPAVFTAPDTLRHLVLDNVLPLALTLRGHDTLHATAVLAPQGACAFVGPSGAGKSTLAASFLFAGHPVLSDDCLILREVNGQMLATPSYPGVRLWDDALAAFDVDIRGSLPVAHYASKRRPIVQEHVLARFPAHAQPLARIYSLARSQGEGHAASAEPRVEPLSQRTGFVELLGSTFMLDRTDQTRWRRQFHFLERLVSCVPVKRLHVPDDFASLPATRAVILDDLRHG